MRDDLLSFYERELSYMRRLGAEFAEKYPKIAGRLLLEPDKCDDPHVERLLEAFAFLAARVHLKLEDELPEVSESLLSILFPNFLAPLPSLSIVQFFLDPEQIALKSGQTIARGSVLSSRPVEGTPCKFRTSFPVTIWPVELTEARFEGAGADAQNLGARVTLRLSLKTLGGLPFPALKQKISETEELPFSTLRLYLHGEARLAHALYELLFNDVVGLELQFATQAGAQRTVRLPPAALKPVGFERDESLLPPVPQAFAGYSYLSEYFTMPEKFLFVDVTGFEQAVAQGAAETIEVLVHANKEFKEERSVNAQSFRLHTTPVVNLFRQVAEPVRLSHLVSEYRVVPDVRRPLATEVFSVDAVTSTSQKRGAVTFQPFYSTRHAANPDEPPAYWHLTRRPSTRKDDEGTEVYLSLVDLGFDRAVTDTETLTIETTCTNRDLPGRLPFGRPEGDFQLEGAGVFSGIRCLRKPTSTLRPALRKGVHWKLLSHLALNHLSLVEADGGGSPDALKEILRLYDVADSSVTRQQIAGLTRLSTRRVVRPAGPFPASFVRGLEVSLEIDELQFVGAGAFLFAVVLERFLALYSSVNSFSQLVVTSKQREGTLRRFAPRTGERIVA